MKMLFLLLLLFGSAFTCYAQDIIYARNGAKFIAKVLEVTPEHIRYRAAGNLAAPVLTARLEEIIWIRYRNGSYEYLNPDPLPNRNSRVTPEQPVQATN